MWRLLQKASQYSFDLDALFPTVVVVLFLLRLFLVAIHGVLSVPAVFLDSDNTQRDRFRQIRFAENVDAFACGDDVVLLVAVVSTAEEYDRRVAIRRSWGSPLRYNVSSTKLLFFTGVTHYHNNAEENADFGDIVLTNVHERYRNLSLKTLAALLFARRHCPRVRCLVKADSDNVLNIAAFERLCRKHYEDASITGHCEVKTNVIRDRFTKWYVPEHVYGVNRYPRYCSSGTYVLVGQKTPGKLLDALRRASFYDSENTRRLPEDVLFTGIAASLASIPRVHSAGFSFWEWPMTACEGSHRVAYSVHAPSTSDLLSEYDRLVAASGAPC
ncbi:hypothetical protein QR680_012903 [Steinernema hermaphroditum]|uniref:Hexosyltransferase n=1 Tax=Steinernema hermaphroditum TaxID=289476 RepID=A0AA39I3P6_9BILA|nr:hypothetical protein QR680_012903 [Steinernema hermaphroditum]